MDTLKKLVLLSFTLLITNLHAADINSDQALNDELAYLRAENYVYSAGKKMQRVYDVAAAIFVISQEDIHRSGATNVPDLLRMVPGLQVAQINANKWGITSRGFNDQFSSKLLVLIDGRTVYTPIFSGVYWHREDTPLEDVERIEVIRGAGAAMWGANAVNGVINIMTKNAKDSQGLLFTAGSGNQEQAFGSIRYGGQLSDELAYRIYAKGFKRDNNLTLTQQNAHDDWESYQAGFKTQWQLNAQDSFTSQGDLYRSRTGDQETFPSPRSPFILTGLDSTARHLGGNIQTRWKHKISNSSETALQLYYKHNDSVWNYVSPVKIQERTLDIDFQHRFSWLEQHDMMWGLNYRYFDFNSEQNFKLGFIPAKRNLQLFTGFWQDDISLLNNELKLTIGTRLEHNDFTGFEVQPNLRLLWTPNNQHSIWAAVSRAVRTPSLSDTGNRFRVTQTIAGLDLPAWVVVSGNPNFKSEEVLDSELGYRAQLTPYFSFDLAGFYNKYTQLRIAKVSPAAVIEGSYLEIPVHYTNNAKGETMGFELTTQWQPVDWFKLQTSYSLLKENLIVLFPNPSRRVPHQQFSLKTALNLPLNIELDPRLRYVDSDAVLGIPHYVAVDLRVAWKPMKNIEFSIVGQNLFDNAHLEYGDEAFEIPRTEIQRSIFGKLSVAFE